ncbi:YidH family protein [Catenuloplanes indicus]|uniref:YidH family protein n=1 Tax=Catenuloplanes indicus TaxID=137267 RepID=UPI00352275B6
MLKSWFDPRDVQRVGSTPDYRFSLANERTFLAWVRTGLALVAGGLAAFQFLPRMPATYLRETIAVVLLLLGGAVAFHSVRHWTRTERAMRLDEDLPPSHFPALLAGGVTLGALVLAATLLLQAFR